MTRERQMRIEIYNADRRPLLPLFALADDSPTQVSTYIALGEVLVAWDDGSIVGHAQILATADVGVFELKSIAVSEARQGEGIGRCLIEAVVAHCRDRKGCQLIVSTATADIGNLRFYQWRGFRMVRIVRDAFGPSSGYREGMLIDGIPLRDQVVLVLELDP